MFDFFKKIKNKEPEKPKEIINSESIDDPNLEIEFPLASITFFKSKESPVIFDVAIDTLDKDNVQALSEMVVSMCAVESVLTVLEIIRENLSKQPDLLAFFNKKIEDNFKISVEKELVDNFKEPYISPIDTLK